MTNERRMLLAIACLLCVFYNVQQRDTHPAPIPIDGFRVLVFEETDERIKYTDGQRDVLQSHGPDSFRSYCETHCVPEGFFVLDKDTPTEFMPKWVQDAAARPRATLPWYLLSDGKKGIEGELPKEKGKALEQAKRFGG